MSSTQVGLSANQVLRQAGLIGKHALAKMSRSLLKAPPTTPTETAPAAGEELDSVFKQHPDLFRDPSQHSSELVAINHALRLSAVKILLIRTQHTTPLVREYLLGEHRLHVCATADRLGEACRQIRQLTYQVLVLSIGENLQDIVPLLDLMNVANPRAKAVAVLEDVAIAQLQQMIHPKVFGYVAAHDAENYLTDAVIEVSQGKFTASPAISDVVMHLTTSYLRERIPTPAQRVPSEPTVASNNEHTVAYNSGFVASNFSSSQLHSSHIHSSFDDGSVFSQRPTVNHAVLSKREREILVLIGGGLSSLEIGGQLAISIPTVNTHIRNMFIKLGVRTRAQAIHVGITQGIIAVQ